MTVTDFPNALPNFYIGFQGSRKLDPRITFTRATDGTGNVNGEVYTFQGNVPRLTSQGLLLEEQRTNISTGTEEFDDDTYWETTASTRTSTTELAPDGSNTGVQFMEINGSTSPWFGAIQTGNRGPLAEATVSVFVKPVNTDTFVIYPLSTGPAYANFTFSTLTSNHEPTTGSFATSGATIEPVGNGWYRCSVTTDYTVAQFFKPVFSSEDVTSTGPGDSTKGCILWGSQIEEGNGPTSYIRNLNTAGGVTRAADVAVIDGDDFTSWFNTAGGTFTFDVPNIPVDGEFSNTFIADIGNNSVVGAAASGYVLTYNFSPQEFVGDTRVNDASQGQITVPVTGSQLKGAYGYETNNFNGAANGTLGTLDTNGTLPTLGTNRVVLGARFNGSADINAPIASWIYYPTRVPDDALVSLTEQQT